MTKTQTDEFRGRVEAEVFVSTEAADYLGMSRQNLSQQTKAGRIPCIRGKLYLRADLDKYNSTVRSEQPRGGGNQRRDDHTDPPIPDL